MPETRDSLSDRVGGSIAGLEGSGGSSRVH
jgi:hypothetical protein